ncbi:hypothetical protein S83_048122, partial [Arachis hypogaea]
LLFRFFSLANTILLIIELNTEPGQNEEGSSRGRFTVGYKNTNLQITLKTAVMLATVRCEEIAREKYKAAKEELHQLEEDMKRSPTEYLNRLSSQIDTCLSESLFVSKAIKAGDCILKVSYRVQITADNIPAKIKSLISEEVANVAKLAVLLLIEGKLGHVPLLSCSCKRTLSGILISAVYHGKRSCITRQNESELEMIHQSSVYWETINQKSQIERDFLAIRP